MKEEKKKEGQRLTERNGKEINENKTEWKKKKKIEIGKKTGREEGK